jgi:hypothetical protein
MEQILLEAIKPGAIKFSFYTKIAQSLESKNVSPSFYLKSSQMRDRQGFSMGRDEGGYLLMDGT